MDVAPTLFCSSQVANQQANAAGVNCRDLLDVENNQAQMADGIAFNQVATVKSNSNLTLQSVKVPYWVGLWMNFKRKPFQMPNL